MKLPPFFALRRYRPHITETHPHLEAFKNIAVIISTTYVGDNIWSLSLVEHPQLFLDDSEIIESFNDKWFHNTTQSICVYSDKVNKVVMKFNNCIIKHSSGCIPLFKMSEPCYTLPVEFLNLYEDENKSFRFEIKMALRPIGKNSQLQEFITKGEACPVTTLPLTRESIRLTSCGHAISKDVEKWIDEKKTCPMCRASQTLNSLSKWTYA